MGVGAFGIGALGGVPVGVTQATAGAANEASTGSAQAGARGVGSSEAAHAAISQTGIGALATQIATGAGLTYIGAREVMASGDQYDQPLRYIGVEPPGHEMARPIVAQPVFQPPPLMVAQQPSAQPSARDCDTCAQIARTCQACGQPLHEPPRPTAQCPTGRHESDGTDGYEPGICVPDQVCMRWDGTRWIETSGIGFPGAGGY